MNQTATTIREPYELPAPPTDRLGAVIAQARWMLGATHTQGAPAIAEVRNAHDSADELGDYLALLAGDGCQVVEYDDFDLDQLRAHGIDYMRTRDEGGPWTDEDEAYWTPEKVAGYVDRSERRATVLDACRNVQFERRRPTFADFDRLLQQGKLVIAKITTRSGSVAGYHPVLVYGRYQDQGCDLYRQYSPSTDGMVTIQRADRLEQMWLGSSLIGVGR